MTKNKGGRPLKITTEVVQKLEAAFIAGCTDLEACCYADISKSSLYNYCDAHPEFMERKETLKNQPVMQAKFIVQESLNTGDLPTANKVIDRVTTQKIEATNTNIELSHEEWLDTLE
jgi:hypothetical protein